MTGKKEKKKKQMPLQSVAVPMASPSSSNKQKPKPKASPSNNKAPKSSDVQSSDNHTPKKKKKKKSKSGKKKPKTTASTTSNSKEEIGRGEAPKEVKKDSKETSIDVQSKENVPEKNKEVVPDKQSKETVNDPSKEPFKDLSKEPSKEVAVVTTGTGPKNKTRVPLVRVGVEVAPAVYQRFGKDRKICINGASRDFIEHLESPIPGSLTGGQLPYTYTAMMRLYRISKMDRAMACGPTKDVVLHRGMPLGKSMQQVTVPYALDIVVLLSIPVVPQMGARDREILVLLQSIARHTCSGYADEYEHIVDEMTLLSQILNEKQYTSMRTHVLTSIMAKKPLQVKHQKQVFDAIGGTVEIDREQILHTLSTLRSRDQLSRDQAGKIKDDLIKALHDRRNGKIRAAELIRKVLQSKNVHIS